MESNNQNDKLIQNRNNLANLEKELRDLVNLKKIIKQNYQSGLEKLEDERKRQIGIVHAWVKEELNNLTKFENKLILFWDFHRKEIEILELQSELKKTNQTDLRRMEITKRLDQLICENVTFGQNLKNRKVNAEILTELRKAIGAWEENE